MISDIKVMNKKLKSFSLTYSSKIKKTISFFSNFSLLASSLRSTSPIFYIFYLSNKQWLGRFRRIQSILCTTNRQGRTPRAVDAKFAQETKILGGTRVGWDATHKNMWHANYPRRCFHLDRAFDNLIETASKSPCVELRGLYPLALPAELQKDDLYKVCSI